MEFFTLDTPLLSKNCVKMEVKKPKLRDREYRSSAGTGSNSLPGMRFRICSGGTSRAGGRE